MSYETILYEKKDKVGIITLNRPDALNALNSQVFSDLYAVITEVENDNEVNAVIITGSGEKAFAAGTDIKEMETLNCNGAREFALGVKKTLDKIETLKKPVIAAINGFALGGGCELAMACDLRIGSEKAKLGQPEINLAVIPGAGGTQRLVRLVGSSIAKGILFTGKIINAETSLTIGLLNSVVPPEELMDEAMKTASIIASKSTVIMGLLKDVVNTGRNLDLPSALAYEIEIFGQCFATEDQKEGFKAFIEKRDPEFKGE